MTEIRPPARRLSRIEHPRDVWMIHQRESLPLGLEARDHAASIHSHANDLQRHRRRYRLALAPPRRPRRTRPRQSARSGDTVQTASPAPPARDSSSSTTSSAGLFSSTSSASIAPCSFTSRKRPLTRRFASAAAPSAPSLRVTVKDLVEKRLALSAIERLSGRLVDSPFHAHVEFSGNRRVHFGGSRSPMPIPPTSQVRIDPLPSPKNGPFRRKSRLHRAPHPHGPRQLPSLCGP